MAWARHPLEFDEEKTFAALETGLTVDLISTFEPDLVTCEVEDDLVAVLTRPDAQDFDHLPVRRGGRIVGVLRRAELEQKLQTGDETQLPTKVADAYKPLDDSTLITSNAGILTFIESADLSPCRLVLTGHHLNGIVTISDLHRLPVRPVLFLLVTHLELLMAQNIGYVSKDNETWLSCLGKRRAKLESDWKQCKEENLEIDILTASQFCDKREAIVKLLDLPVSRSEARRQLKDIEKLRNAVAHGSEYAQTSERALETIRTVKVARDWIDRLAQLAREHPLKAHIRDN